MPVTCTNTDRTLHASITGDVDHHAVKDLMAQLEMQMDRYVPSSLVLDCTGITFMDSSGIAVILRLWHRMKATDGQMTVHNVPAQAFKVLRAAGLDRLITFE